MLMKLCKRTKFNSAAVKSDIMEIDAQLVRNKVNNECQFFYMIIINSSNE